MDTQEYDVVRQAHLGHVDDAQIIVEEAIPGKRIKPGQGSIVHDPMYGYLIFQFDDDTWAVWEANAYGEVTINFRENKLEPASLNYLELITGDEYETFRFDIKSRENDEFKERRYKSYLALKAEFEGDD